MNQIVILTLIVLAIGQQTAARPQFNQFGGQGGQFGQGQRPGQFGQGQRPGQFGGNQFGNQQFGGNQFAPGANGAGFSPFPVGGTGNAAGFGTGNAGPGGVSASGGGIATSSNGGVATASGQGFGSGSPFGGFNAGGTGQGVAVGK